MFPTALATRTDETLESTPPDIADITFLLPTFCLISSTLFFINFPGFQLFLQSEIINKKFEINCFPKEV